MSIEILLNLLDITQWKEWITYDSENPLLFNSSLFLGLFTVFYVIYVLLRRRFRLRLLYVVAFSLFFYYKSSGIYFLLLVGTTIVDYYLAKLISTEKRVLRKKLYLGISVTANLAVLGYFKYTNFFVESLNELSGSEFHLRAIILPVGISFFTFQSIGYIIEIYRKEVRLAETFLDYIFYISFFPQLVAGPIVRAKDFLPQVYAKVKLTRDELNEAFILILGGLIKKAVISDYISVNFVDRVFDSPNSYSGVENLVATYGYAVQIYCDFSGYSDMAIGLALLMGFRLPINFRTPYKSASITEFWRRWHISLSTWLKDFLYISAGGNRTGSFGGYFFPSVFFGAVLIWGGMMWAKSAIPLYIALGGICVFLVTFLFAKDRKKKMFTNFNLMTTMLLGGLWHGASLRFIVWGALHGLALIVHKTVKSVFPKTKNRSRWMQKSWYVLSVIITFHFVCFCWIFFRASSFSVALDIISNIGELEWNPEKWHVLLKAYRYVALLILTGLIWHFTPQRLIEYMASFFNRLPLLAKGTVAGFVFWLVYATAGADTQPFIYFQF